MKTKSIIIALIFIASASLFYNFKAKPDEEKPETIIVTAVPSYKIDQSKIYIYFGDGKIETVQMEKHLVDSYTENPAIKTLSITLNKLNSQGYEIVSSSDGNFRYTFILQRKK